MSWNTNFHTCIINLSGSAEPLTHLTEQATQQLSIWHSNFGSTALTIMAHFLASSDDTRHPGTVWEMCKDLLDGLAFLFQDLDPMNSKNVYRSQLLLQLLAHTHLWSCVGCPDIPNLNTHSLKEYGIKGAISLCCAAISTHSKAMARTLLKLNRTSRKELSTALAFSEQNWGSCTWQYFMLVNRCGHAALKEVITMANSVLMSTMDSTMLEDSTFQDDVMADDLVYSLWDVKAICTKSMKKTWVMLLMPLQTKAYVTLINQKVVLQNIHSKDGYYGEYHMEELPLYGCTTWIQYLLYTKDNDTSGLGSTTALELQL
ncbi:hypothetical protein EDD16DRAFT_1521590 [Pisolithus croceorrhizus]|nr:hypothetical protein EDD16DRAFT_1521590 [Pisolithus croceorrhizus]KAI6138340.1 hypothetical protein EDD17DRAFT_1516891 [Pisolithus thermaeus]